MSDQELSNWVKFGFEEKISEILEQIHYVEPGHHFRRPFLSAYQIAIEFARKHPDVVESLGYKIGGKGIGERKSLAQYIARQLSGKIKQDENYFIEGAFISNLHLKTINFIHDKEEIESSLTDSQFDLSMFRLVE